MKLFTNFTFSMNTEIVFGKGTENQVAGLIRKYGGSKVMLVYGGSSTKKIGLYDTVAQKLNEAKIPFTDFGGVQPNPRRSLAEKGLKEAMMQKVDFVLAMGGGSTIDTAKAIAVGLAYGGEYWKFYNGAVPEKTIPVGAIHTISAAGSETSGVSVLVDDVETHLKKSFTSLQCRPVFAIMNPELTYGVSPYQTGAGAADILSHTVMRYFIEPASYLGDQYCIATMRTAVKYGPIAVQKPNDYEARAELMLAGSFSHNDLTGIGRSFAKKGGEHSLERQLSGLYDTAHGAGLAAVMPAWMQYMVDCGQPMHLERVANFAVHVFDVEPDMSDLKAVANEGLVRFRNWIRAIGMPLTLKELGIPKEDLQDVIDHVVENGTIPGFIDLDREVVTGIFTPIVE